MYEVYVSPPDIEHRNVYVVLLLIWPQSPIQAEHDGCY